MLVTRWKNRGPPAGEGRSNTRTDTTAAAPASRGPFHTTAYTHRSQDIHRAIVPRG